MIPTPASMDHLPRDRRGLPVPHVAGWSSEVWGVARAETLIPAAPMALCCKGRQGRGRPMFDIVNEERQRRAVLLGRCQVCDDLLERRRHDSRVQGYLPAASITVESHGLTEDGRIVTHEPLCCRPCAEWTAAACCHLKRHSAEGVLAVTDWSMLLQMVDPSAGPPRKSENVDENDLAKLGRIAARHGGLVGFVKVVLDQYEVVA